MADVEELADRIREVVQGELGPSEKRMFGGLAFLIDGKLAVSASSKGGLLLSIDPTLAESLVSEPHARPFEMPGRQMDGWLRVDAEVLQTDDELRRWGDPRCHLCAITPTEVAEPVCAQPSWAYQYGLSAPGTTIPCS